MNTSLQRKIHYLCLATLFAGGLGILEGKWYEIIAGGLLCTSSGILAILLFPVLLKHNKNSKWNKTGFLIEFILLLLLALIHVIPAHYPLSIILAILSIFPTVAWIRLR